jgi:hypothetical protein
MSIYAAVPDEDLIAIHEAWTFLDDEERKDLLWQVVLGSIVAHQDWVEARVWVEQTEMVLTRIIGSE